MANFFIFIEYESGRKVQYDNHHQLFLCSCKHTTFSISVTTVSQLNLTRLPDS